MYVIREFCKSRLFINYALVPRWLRIRNLNNLSTIYYIDKYDRLDA